jgi:hypothetical protein
VAPALLVYQMPQDLIQQLMDLVVLVFKCRQHLEILQDLLLGHLVQTLVDIMSLVVEMVEDMTVLLTHLLIQLNQLVVVD